MLEEARRQRLVYEDQFFLPRAVYPRQWETSVTLRDGTRATLRPVRPTDEAPMKDMFYSCSEQSIYNRYFGYVKAMPHAKLQRVVNVDYEDEMTVVATVEEGGQERLVASAGYILNRASNMADLAFLVRDDFHGRGVGTLLFAHLMRIARERGVAGFTADVFAHNRSMLHILHKSGCEMKSALSGNVYHLEFRLDKQQDERPARPAKAEGAEGGAPPAATANA